MIWVTTESGDSFGPYEDYADAYFFARTMFGFDGWSMTRSDDKSIECADNKLRDGGEWCS